MSFGSGSSLRNRRPAGAENGGSRQQILLGIVMLLIASFAFIGFVAVRNDRSKTPPSVGETPGDRHKSSPQSTGQQAQRKTTKVSKPNFNYELQRLAREKAEKSRQEKH